MNIFKLQIPLQARNIPCIILLNNKVPLTIVVSYIKKIFRRKKAKHLGRGSY